MIAPNEMRMISSMPDGTANVKNNVIIQPDDNLNLTIQRDDNISLFRQMITLIEKENAIIEPDDSTKWSGQCYHLAIVFKFHPAR
jgi:hypothetical protein